MTPYKKNDPFYTTGVWKKLRRQALDRDHWICQECLREVEMGKRIRAKDAVTVHHIKPRSKYPELELTLENLESLCDEHHNKEHPERGFKPHRREMENARRCITIKNERSLDRG